MQLQRTKIVCTIGPASSDPAVLRRMVEAGMDVARLNFSHGTHPEKKERIRALRKISKDLDCPLAIVADLQGPKLRLGAFEGIREISKGEKLTLSLAPRTDKELPMQFDLSRFVKKA
ncbi:MAG: pyruvate kinase, partial [Candidatus Sungbacteria bacterium]|nr:pyruvate kinase [Candidatus Sungbacteria bacterium]